MILKNITIMIILTAILMIAPAFTASAQEDTTSGENLKMESATNAANAGDTYAPGNVETVEKVYYLEHISIRRVKKRLKKYIIKITKTNEPNTIRVKLAVDDVKIFEEKLYRLDNESDTLVNLVLSIPKVFKKKKRIKHTVHFKLFTVLAGKEEGQNDISDKDLLDVLNELSGVLNFKSFKMDGVSSIAVNEASPHNVLKLSSQYSALKLRLDHIKVKGKRVGSREIYIDRLILREDRDSLISTRTSVQEDGYLVVGVTQIGEEQNSLVLIMYATIQ
ncbi:MAG: hypothetical protein GY757_62100 [bacterium]|nr:hypothetical protein [bacterium]